MIIVEKEHIINYDDAWYMICYDRTKNDIRTFNISRIKDISATKEKFLRHGKEYREELKRTISSGYGIFKGKDVFSVKIRFRDEAARIVESQVWHSEQKFRWIDKNRNSAVLSFPVSNFTEVLGKVLAFGSKAEPVSPKKFVNMWKEEIKMMAQKLEG